MKRLHVILAIALLAVTVGAGWWSVRLWRRQQLVATALAAVPPLPNLVRWPADMVTAVQTTTAAAGRAKDPLPPLGRLAAIYHVNGFAAEAKQVLGALREMEPHTARWAYLLADLYLRAGDAAGAEPALRATVELAPDYVPAWIRLGDLYLGREDLARAEESYARAAREAPGNVRAEFALISFEAWHGRRGDPRRSLTDLVRANPGIKELHDLLARIEAAAGDESRAAEERKLAAAAVQHIETRDPWIDELASFCFDPNRLGLMAYKLGRERRLIEAETLLKRAILLGPGDTTLRQALSELYEKMERLTDARAVLESAVKDCPDDPKMPELLSRVLCLEHKPDDAVTVVTRALARWPGNASLHAALGYALRDGRRNTEAIAALREAVRLDPSLVEAHYNLGFCLLAHGEREAARAEAEQAVSMRPNYPEALVLLGSLAIEAGDVATAERHITRLYALQPDEPGSRLLYAALHLIKGTAADKAGHLDEAAELFQAGLQASPNLGPLLRESGSVAMRRGAFADAVELLRRYVRIEPADATAFAWLGEALVETDHPADARKILEQGKLLAQKAGNQAQVDEFTLLLQRTRR